MSEVLDLFGSSWFFIAALLAVLSDAFLPIVPSGTMVIAATLQSSETHTSPLLLGLGVAVASFSGDLLLIRIARRGAVWAQRRLDSKPGAASAATYLLQALETRRARTIIAARFVPGGRSVLDLAVGTSPMPPRRFLRWSAVSAAVWATYIVGLGYLNEHTFDTSWLSFAVSCAAATAISAVIARMVQRQRRSARQAAAAAAPDTDDHLGTAPVAVS
ncbi:DedA family protein [Streptacidiphilus carbonis]|uniref:DedA family protein n=1 Tax=Streptacidiphilus carbonis TaxID=105422 RepID=UPI000694C2DE|nr:VTT domain-containing protein [Streptacidiphilus carbonis]